MHSVFDRGRCNLKWRFVMGKVSFAVKEMQPNLVSRPHLFATEMPLDRGRSGYEIKCNLHVEHQKENME